MLSGRREKWASSAPSVTLTRRQFVLMRISLFSMALAVLGMVLAVWVFYSSRANAREGVRQLACYAIRYTADDKGPVVRDLRQRYRCPPPLPLPAGVARTGAPSPVPSP